MIELEVNGKPHRIDPATVDELERAILEPVPSGHGVCRLLIDGREVSDIQLAECDPASIRHVRIESSPLEQIAQNALEETQEWIGRICGVLDSIANDYRLGDETQGASRLPDVADALQVLVHLLHGLQTHLPIEDSAKDSFWGDWESAQLKLHRAIDGLTHDVAAADPIQLADRLGYSIPRALNQFRELLSRAKTAAPHQP